MIWMLANLHSERKILVVSAIDGTSKYRRYSPVHGARVLSAFASELSAEKEHGYRIEISGSNTVFLHPPLPNGSLEKITYEQVKHAMKKPDVRDRVSKAYDELCKMLEHAKSSQTLASSNTRTQPSADPDTSSSARSAQTDDALTHDSADNQSFRRG